MYTRGGCSTSTVSTYYADIEIHIDFAVNGNNMQIAFTRAGFTVGMETQGIGLLGQQGFFENYKTSFDRKGKTFGIELP
jgi:hypothetical protein